MQHWGEPRNHRECKPWRSGTTIWLRQVGLYHFYLVICDPWTKSKSKLSGETKHRGRGLWLGTPQEFCRWRQSQLLLAFLCRMASNSLEQTNLKVWFINLNLINLRATSTGGASFYSQIGIFHLALTIPRKENAAGDHRICTILQSSRREKLPCCTTLWGNV